jgi:hypothetical protein
VKAWTNGLLNFLHCQNSGASTRLGSQTLTFLAPPPLSTYHVVVSCHSTFNGQNVEFGHVEQDVSG